MKKTKRKINVLIYKEFTILEVSKTMMWRFFYDCLKPKYRDKTKLFYTDTDSFTLHTNTKDFY